MDDHHHYSIHSYCWFHRLHSKLAVGIQCHYLRLVCAWKYYLPMKIVSSVWNCYYCFDGRISDFLIVSHRKPITMSLNKVEMMFEFGPKFESTIMSIGIWLTTISTVGYQHSKRFSALKNRYSFIGHYRHEINK